MELKGKIKKVLEVQKGTTKDGKEWQKLNFVVENNDGYEGREAIYCFEIFGEEKVQNFIKFNKAGDSVDVSFNISTNEWQGKYFTGLQAWKVFKSDVNNEVAESPNAGQQFKHEPAIKEEEDGLPF